MLDHLQGRLPAVRQEDPFQPQLDDAPVLDRPAAQYLAHDALLLLQERPENNRLAALSPPECGSRVIHDPPGAGRHPRLQAGLRGARRDSRLRASQTQAVPPPAGVRPPALWGTEARLRELFDGASREIAVERKHFAFRYGTPAHFVEVFRRWYGPTVLAFAALDAGGQAALARDLEALLARHHRGGTGLSVPSEYVEVVVTRS